MNEFKNKAELFSNDLPYKKPPYSGRNWGHKWHSLCSYHGKLKPAIAHFLIKEFTRPGEIILDPLCGVGTIPFEACLQGRIGIGNDLSELAYCVSKAKLERPEKEDVYMVIDDLRDYITSGLPAMPFDATPYQDFGLNHTLKEYFHPDTYREIILARKYLLDHFDFLSASEAMVFTALAHVLHGNRPYALSRRSHPLTPYAPTGEYEYKNVIEHIKSKIDIAYSCTDFNSFRPGITYRGDYKNLSNIQADAIITSPPFADSMKFYTQNWMRLWLMGWEPDDFHNANKRFLDNQQNTNLDVYLDFFQKCYANLKDDGIVILHLGKTDKIDMADELGERAEPYFETIYKGIENVSSLEKHGIKDKGGTTEHEYLFLQKRAAE